MQIYSTRVNAIVTAKDSSISLGGEMRLMECWLFLQRVHSLLINDGSAARAPAREFIRCRCLRTQIWTIDGIDLVVCLSSTTLRCSPGIEREKRETEETPDWSINALIDFADFRRSHLINVRECTCTRISSTRYTFSPYNQISARFEKLICIFFFPLYFRMLASKKKETINWPTNVHENESSLVDERLCS